MTWRRSIKLIGLLGLMSLAAVGLVGQAILPAAAFQAALGREANPEKFAKRRRSRL
jgi:hypothetical protein